MQFKFSSIFLFAFLGLAIALPVPAEVDADAIIDKDGDFCPTTITEGASVAEAGIMCLRKE
jgi:hypothetical protein